MGLGFRVQGCLGGEGGGKSETETEGRWNFLWFGLFLLLRPYSNNHYSPP